MQSEKSILLRPDWRSYFWWLFWGVLLIPLFGLGLILLLTAHRKRSSLACEIRDRSVILHEGDSSTNIGLSEIERVEIRQRWIDKITGTGDIGITRASKPGLSWIIGQARPQELAAMIREAARADRERVKQRNRSEIRTPDHDPGTLDRLDYLTGLWHQGLISDEEYRREKKYFR